MPVSRRFDALRDGQVDVLMTNSTLTLANAESQHRLSRLPPVRRLLGEGGELGKALRVDPRWAYLMLRTVGNYGEVFERNFGANAPLKLERGLNSWLCY